MRTVCSSARLRKCNLLNSNRSRYSYHCHCSFVSDANRSYPLKPRESHRRRAIGENPHPDTCILVAISAGGLVAHKMKSMGSVTTSTEFMSFVQMVLKKYDSEATMFYGFDSAPAEIANAIKDQVASRGHGHKAFFLRRSSLGNPATCLFHDVLQTMSRKRLDRSRNEGVDMRFESALSRVTSSMCSLYIRQSFPADE